MGRTTPRATAPIHQAVKCESLSSAEAPGMELAVARLAPNPFSPPQAQEPTPMQYQQSRQDRLNRAFEFQEVLLAPKERSRLQRGVIPNPLFATEPEGYVLTDYKLRTLSVRLRTINNACDAMATLPDGTPITEVSMYGSRDRQYLVGPYFAVMKLMNGDDVPVSTAEKTVSNRREAVSRHLEALAGIRRSVVAKDGLVRTSFDGTQHQFQPSDLPVIDAFISEMDRLATEFDELLSRTQKKPWWWPWTDESKEIEQHAALLEERHRSHLKEFLVNLYPEIQGSGQK